MKDSTLLFVGLAAAGLGVFWYLNRQKTAMGNRLANINEGPYYGGLKEPVIQAAAPAVPMMLATPAAGMEWKNVNGQWTQVKKSMTLQNATNPFAML